MAKYAIDYDFSSVNNEKEAYILGFICADGHVMENPARLGIMLASRDKYLLEQIRDYISKESPVKDTKNYSFNGIEKYSSTFIVCRKSVVSNLKNLGVLPNKTHKDFNIPNIREDLVRHFIRGYFDGDGGIVKGKYLRFFICAPLPNIIKDFVKILLNNGIYCIFSHDRRKGKKSNISKSGVCNYDQYKIIVSKRIHLEQLFDFLYKECTIKLDRKYDIFKEYIDTDLERTSRNSNLIEFNGEIKTLKEWAAHLGISNREMNHRLYYSDWSKEEALSFKKGENKRRQLENTPKGENHPNTKFSKEDIISIFLSKDRTMDLAKKYSVHRDTIRNIRTGRYFKSVLKNIIKPI